MNEQTSVSAMAPIPDHVPEAIVFDFDMYRDPDLLTNPLPRILDLLKTAPPIFWTPRNGGHWIFLSHASNFDAARDTDAFSNEAIPYEQIQAMKAQMPPDAPQIPLPFPLLLDPPLHGKYRRPLQTVFSPKIINGLKDGIRALAIEIIGKVAPEGKCEFINEIAVPLPVQVFLKMLGLPIELMPEYRALVKEVLSQHDSDPAAGLMRLQRVTAAMRDTVLARREDPKDDIISLLWSLEIDGKPVTLNDIENYGVLLFIAGLDTVVNSMGYAVYHLAQDQALQKRLRRNPDLIPEAVEEMLRRYSFVIPPRRLKKDIVFHGFEMKENERVMLFLPAADLDSDVFPDAEKFDLNRENKGHIVFNAGPHRCLGSHLARVELQIFYQEFLSRMPNFSLDPKRPPTFHCGQILGFDTLDLIWEPK